MWPTRTPRRAGRGRAEGEGGGWDVARGRRRLLGRRGPGHVGVNGTHELVRAGGDCRDIVDLDRWTRDDVAVEDLLAARVLEHDVVGERVLVVEGERERPA